MMLAVTMVNAGFFLGKDAGFVPRAQAAKDLRAGKRGGTFTIARRLNQPDVIDNPTTHLKKDEWNRVVAMIYQGCAVAFKGGRYSDPVDLL